MENPESINQESVESQAEPNEKASEPVTPSRGEPILETKPPKLFPKSVLIVILSVLTVLGLALASYFLVKSGRFKRLPGPPGIPTAKLETKVAKFSSEAEFKAYLQEAQSAMDSFFGTAGFGAGAVGPQDLAVPQPAMMKEGVSEATPALERVSETTVQVAGVDEPDIVKTDGVSIFFSSSTPIYRPLPEPLGLEEKIGSPPIYQEPGTKVIAVFPPADLATDATIDKRGNLLLSNKILVIFSGNQILGYDVSNPKNPTKKWEFELESKNQIVASRLYKDKVYVVAQTRIVSGRPCPIPLVIKGGSISIPCTDIYHPAPVVPVDSTFTAISLDPKTGSVENRVSFVGSSGISVVYMSEGAIYVTYTYYKSMVDFFYNFYKEVGQDLLPKNLLEKMARLKDYDISDLAKFTEFSTILENYQASLTEDERLRVENETTNRLEAYMKERLREFEKSGIVKIGLDGLTISASGEIPGRLLNQFSLDEYQGNLRVATTVSGNWVGSAESENDVYVMNKDLSIIGQVLGMGLTERIYSVRFIEDKGYVVTFKQVDPFYVLDLSNPANPKLSGQLKIPGYSAYLHPITKDKILGIGKEGSQVKVSLFDTSDPASPSELSKYTLDEYWSDILNTHHAFLLDSKHSVFFLPGGKGGYIFSYKDDVLSLTRAVTDISAKRAIYINDYLYIIGDTKITVLNEVDWQEVNSLTF